MDRRQKFMYSRNWKCFYKASCQRRQQLRDRRIPRASLHLPMLSSWHELYFSQNNQAFVMLTGFDHCTFTWLLHIFEPVYLPYSPGDKSVDGYMVRICHSNHGCPCLMTSANCLGLNLAWTRLRGSIQPLQMIFGLMGTRVSVWLPFGRRLLIMILSGRRNAAIQIPSDSGST